MLGRKRSIHEASAWSWPRCAHRSWRAGSEHRHHGSCPKPCFLLTVEHGTAANNWWRYWLVIFSVIFGLASERGKRCKLSVRLSDRKCGTCNVIRLASDSRRSSSQIVAPAFVCEEKTSTMRNARARVCERAGSSPTTFQQCSCAMKDATKRSLPNSWPIWTHGALCSLLEATQLCASESSSRCWRRLPWYRRAAQERAQAAERSVAALVQRGWGDGVEGLCKSKASHI